MTGKKAKTLTAPSKRSHKKQPSFAPGRVKEVVYDPLAHREFVTGFHKRKLQRQAVGRKQALEREKLRRIAMKKEKNDLHQQMRIANHAAVSVLNADNQDGLEPPLPNQKRHKAPKPLPEHRKSKKLSAGPVDAIDAKKSEDCLVQATYPAAKKDTVVTTIVTPLFLK